MVYNAKLLVLLLPIVIGHCYRLPSSVIPNHYELQIVTNLGNENNKFEFSGMVNIHVKCINSTQNITLHSKDLKLNTERIEVKDENNKLLDADSFATDSENDFFTIILKDYLKANSNYVVSLTFSAELKNTLSGYYRSSYIDSKTREKQYLATTQFQPTDARRAFPCFDEPAMKATFRIDLCHHEKYLAISNMPLRVREIMKDKPKWVWSRFKTSLPMSTYLVAYIVSDFAFKESPQLEHNNVTFKIWSRKDAIKQVEFAADIGPKVLHFYEKYFNIDYPLPKQDMVAVPDFAAGAMENWGLITYRETALLYDPDRSSIFNKNSVASVISHELAHQWFGNLVTMNWWTDLWLNEGFATYMAALSVQNMFPEWKTLEEESVDNFLVVFDFDSLESSHPVSVPIGHPREINQIFDTIAYKKGSFLLRMMSLFLGEETLRKGVSNYLINHKYQNAEQDDLWEALTKQAHIDKTLPNNLTVKMVMDTWTKQTGYPVIFVNRLYNESQIEFRQQRFLRRNIVIKNENPESWLIPVVYTDSSELQFNSTRPKFWLPATKEVFTRKDSTSNDSWIILNTNLASLYRVNYDERNWQLLIETLNSPEFDRIPVLSRIQLIDDSYLLGTVGYLDYKIYFDLCNYLVQEDQYLVWKSGLRSLNVINKFVKRTSTYGAFRKYMVKLISPIYDKLEGLSGFSNKTFDKARFSVMISSTACKLKIKDCTESALNLYEMFKNNTKDSNIIPKELRSTVLCIAIRNGGEDDWNFLWKLYKSSNVASEKDTISTALSCASEEWLLQRYLEWTIEPKTIIRPQDASSIFSSVAHAPLGFYVAQRFLENRIQDIHKILGGNSKRIGRYVTTLASQMMTETELKWLENFIERNKEYLVDAQQSVDQGLEIVRLNLQWRNIYGERISQLLNVASRNLERNQFADDITGSDD